MISNDEVKVLRQKYPEKFICADATSIAGGVYYDIGQLDVFLFSVQKCFSVPSGLGIMICSPRFFEKAKQNQEKGEHIGIVHNLVDMQKKMETKYQTQETPPVMQIGLLNAVIKRIKADYGDIHATEKEVKRRAFFLWDFFEKHEELEPFPVNSEYRSDTVIVVSGEEDVIAKYRKKAEQVGISMAGGYGKTKSHAFRVANFTASDMKSMENLVENL
ncbi:MAG: aminotransferase class V-fold PLP-dependent enzyme, partial [Candidatus Gracilibacteria bacterium]|jgi:phosphoserine aminotransferase|nr:aminotransferase class V-fold PLP-dependent enzyme [Candidatus Gracilibacteria bacterium]